MLTPKSMVNADPTSKSAKPSIREIGDEDVNAVVDLLARGFDRPRNYWEVALGRLRTRSTPPDMPRYGYMLEADGQAVGVILLISSLRRVGGRRELFSNLSSWFVEPNSRSYATMLYRHALAHKQTTYLNVSAATNVWPIIEAFGFKRYSQGQVLAALALARNRQGAPARIVELHKLNDVGLDGGERRLLEVQAGYGCITFACVTQDQIRPFVFVPRVVRGFIPCAQLAYCRNSSDLIDVAGTVGRHLLRLGRPFVLIDANGPIPGLPSKYFPDVAPRYYRGATLPVLGDLTETEATIFGI